MAGPAEPAGRPPVTPARFTLPPFDPDKRRQAAILEHTSRGRWLVLWGPGSHKFFAFAKFPHRDGGSTILRCATFEGTAKLMRTTEIAVFGMPAAQSVTLPPPRG